MATHYPPTLEQFGKNVVKTTKYIRSIKPDVPILFVWDSIGVAMTEREWREIDLPDKPTKEQIKESGGMERPGERAKAAGKVLRQVNPFIDKENATLYVINQERSNIGVCYGNPKVTAGGGEALKYYASCRLSLFARKKIKDKDTDVVVGVNLTVRNEKNRTHRPFLQTEGIQIYFDGGINPIGGLLSILIGSGRIKQTSKGNYQVCEPWAAGQESKFKASVTRNDLPVDVLLSCPLLVDGTCATEVENYLKNFESALKLSTGDTIKEVSTTDDGDNDIEKLMEK
jgi:hypothetical protein